MSFQKDHTKKTLGSVPKSIKPTPMPSMWLVKPEADSYHKHAVEANSYNKLYLQHMNMAQACSSCSK